jgi:hypothetical protein
MGGNTGNTFDSHRLIYYAGTKGKQVFLFIFYSFISTHTGNSFDSHWLMYEGHQGQAGFFPPFFFRLRLVCLRAFFRFISYI